MKKLDHKITAVPQWDKTAKDVWNERFAALTDDEEKDEDSKPLLHKTISLRGRTKYFLSVAAAVLLLLIATAFIYTKEVKAVPGCACTICLPDGSLAQLSLGTTISYRPLIWMLSPRVYMTGEAYFSGKHANGFSVKTLQGDIEVIGTSFNARTYDDKLVVTCLDGKIKVKSTQMSVELTANMETTLRHGKLTTEYIPDAESSIGWTKGLFSFYNKPLVDVLKDVERYFDVKIEIPEGIDSLRYTGKFTREKSIGEVLAIIGQPYGLNFKIGK